MLQAGEPLVCISSPARLSQVHDHRTRDTAKDVRVMTPQQIRNTVSAALQHRRRAVELLRICDAQSTVSSASHYFTYVIYLDYMRLALKRNPINRDALVEAFISHQP
jgi:hypothetical protein